MFELMALPGLTQELAAGICHVREKRGHFKTIDALLKVKGKAKYPLSDTFYGLNLDNSGK